MYLQRLPNTLYDRMCEIMIGNKEFIILLILLFTMIYYAFLLYEPLFLCKEENSDNSIINVDDENCNKNNFKFVKVSPRKINIKRIIHLLKQSSMRLIVPKVSFKFINKFKETYSWWDYSDSG